MRKGGEISTGYNPNPYANWSCDTTKSCRTDCIIIREALTGKTPKRLFGLGPERTCPENIVCPPRDPNKPLNIKIVR
jgi:hypothetical protein